jgi:propanol-preferring alcohol dehydrogenase
LDPYHGKEHVGVGSRGHGPVIPGHEGSGIVESTGPDVETVKVGDRVAVYTFVSCNNCGECRSGFWMLCRDARCLGFDRDGPDAERLLVPARNCLRIPDWMTFVEGSLVTDL